MVQSLYFYYVAKNFPEEKQRILDALLSEEPVEIVVERFRMSFDPVAQYVIVDKASPDVDFAAKIIKCRMPYRVMRDILTLKDWDMTGFEYIE